MDTENQNFTVISGYISVSSVMKSKSRDIERIILDKDRKSKVFSSDFHFPEKKQYEAIEEYVSTHKTPVSELSSEEFESIVGKTVSGGIAASVGERKIKSADELIAAKAGFYLIIDGIEDPFNFGYVLRTAYASGCGGVFLPERNYFTSSETVIKSSAGASELLDIAYYTDVEETVKKLKENGVSIACTSDEKGSVSLEKAWLDAPICVVIGGERRGINKGLMSMADVILRIDYKRSYEMSLAASSAASIIIYEVAKKIFSGKVRTTHKDHSPKPKSEYKKKDFNKKFSKNNTYSEKK